MLWHKDFRKTSGGYWQCPIKRREASKRWRKNYPEKEREFKKKWKKNNPEKRIEINKRWAKNNPEKVKESQRKYEEKRLRIGVGGLQFSYRIDAEKKEQVREKLQEFRNLQKEEYNGWIDQTIKRA